MSPTSNWLRVLNKSGTMKKKEKKYRIECTERQLRLIASCVEDCHRFMGGQVELWNMASLLDNYSELRYRLDELKPLVTPHLPFNASYGWSGGDCPNEHQRKFIAETYPIYREILHYLACQDKDNGYNVYKGSTLTCKEGGEPIRIKEIKRRSIKPSNDYL